MFLKGRIRKKRESSYHFHPVLKHVAFFMAIIFSWDTVVWANPDFASISQINSRSSHEVRIPNLLHQINIPENIGTIHDKYLPKQSTLPLIVHIQDALPAPEILCILAVQLDAVGLLLGSPRRCAAQPKLRVRVAARTGQVRDLEDQIHFGLAAVVFQDVLVDVVEGRPQNIKIAIFGMQF